MEFNSILSALLGGMLIGLSVTIMLLFNGRVTGVSGIIASSLARPTSEGFWRWAFLVGMIAGGVLMFRLRPDFFVNETQLGLELVIPAGLLVGFGTVMGSGCTSGHGVCGISRFSVRSAVATVTFMFFGFLAVQAVRFFVGGSL